MIGRLGVASAPPVEVVRLRQLTAQEKARAAADAGSKWAKWAPFIVAGAVLAFGAVALAARARSKRS